MATQISRRALLGRFRGGPPQLRPPWAWSDATFTDRCTLCEACIEACPERIIVAGHAGYPIVDFSSGGCTFCGACRQICSEDCFDLAEDANPWAQHAVVGMTCVEHKGVACRMCESACEANALSFRPAVGGRSTVTVQEDRCTGCGSCLSHCPVGAISIQSMANAERHR